MTALCQGCGQEFPSRNAVFRHLRETNGACLKVEDQEEFERYIMKQERRVKVLVLYGYYILCNNNKDNITSGEQASRLVVQAISKVCGGIELDCTKIQRSYGHASRDTDVCRQDDQSSAISELLSVKIPLPRRSEEEFITTVNAELPSNIQVFAFHKMPFSKFNAEMDVTHRRVEYMIPAELLCPPHQTSETFLNSLPMFAGKDVYKERDYYHSTVSEQRPTGEIMDFLSLLKKTMQAFTTRVETINPDQDAGAFMEKSFHVAKRKTQRKAKELKKRNNKRKNANGNDAIWNKTDQEGNASCRKSHKDDSTKEEEEEEENNANDKHSHNEHNTSHNKEPKKQVVGATTNPRPPTTNTRTPSTPSSKLHVLRRKRFHNFTPQLMAHEFLAYRRLDRFHRVATVRYGGRPFFILGVTGDLFLHGQVLRVVGLLCALMQQRVPPDMLECVFDESYPHLVPVLPVPAMGLMSCDAQYSTWEGKSKLILSPRLTNRYEDGFNSVELCDTMSQWQTTVRQEVAQQWIRPGMEQDGRRLTAERTWTTNVLEPWAQRANQQLQEYRAWKQATTAVAETSKETASTGTCSPIGLLPCDTFSTPLLYQRVLHLLREANSSGKWPRTTAKRKLVMVNHQDSGGGTLSMARMIAKSTKEQNRESAYSENGNGGASGSFSIGYMPGETTQQPKSNNTFPELVEAAFALEVALKPNRPPSSTIAVNRNALFRPHRDSGAGAGQGISLIVGLGDYSGGQLMVEGQEFDIRYQPKEFNGWTQRHWTKPFEGERFSLVWFTPKGCENMRGIDLKMKKL